MRFRRVYIPIMTFLMACSLSACQTEKSAVVQGDSTSQTEARAVNQEDARNQDKNSDTEQENSTQDKEAQADTSASSLKDLDLDHLTGEQLAALSKDLYTIYSDMESTSYMDGSGHILTDWDTSISPVLDTVSNETRYYVASYKEVTKKNKKRKDIVQYSRLYDLDGQILIDWIQGSITQAFGDLVLIKEEDIESIHFSYLYNLKTGEKQDNVWYMERLDGPYVFCMGNDESSTGIVDEKGDIVAGFPFTLPDGQVDILPQGTYLQSWSNTDDDDYLYNFYDLKGSKIGSLKVQDGFSLDNMNMVGSYFTCNCNVKKNGKTKKKTRLYQVDGEKKKIELIKTFPKHDAIQYCDGQLAIIKKASKKYYLYDIKTGQKLTDDYELIKYYSQDIWLDDREPSPYFVALKDSVITKLDRKGKILATQKQEEARDIYVYEDCISLMNGDYNNSALLDWDLNCLIPFGKYYDISLAFDPEGDQGAVYSCSYEIPNCGYRYDLIREDGSLLMDSVTNYGYGHGPLYPIVRGKYAGLIDYEGNWISRISRFDLENMD